jgi:2,3-bisphosphoglycerate-dependent phosphoglycerate mutase
VQLLLIRHAEPVKLLETDGPADPPLHDRGHEQSRRLAAWLAAEPLHGVVSSPMQRARQTAAPVAAAHGLEIVVDTELAEFDREASEYVPYEELKSTQDPRFVAMALDRLADLAVDPAAFQAGVVAAMERVIVANPGRTVAVVCHGGVINAYTAHVAGTSRLLWFETAYTSISRVAASRGGHRSVMTLNETPHLRGTGLLPAGG